MREFLLHDPFDMNEILFCRVWRKYGACLYTVLPSAHVSFQEYVCNFVNKRQPNSGKWSVLFTLNALPFMSLDCSPRHRIIALVSASCKVAWFSQLYYFTTVDPQNSDFCRWPISYLKCGSEVVRQGGLTLVYTWLWSIEILDFGLLNLC